MKRRNPKLQFDLFRRLDEPLWSAPSEFKFHGSFADGVSAAKSVEQEATTPEWATRYDSIKQVL